MAEKYTFSVEDSLVDIIGFCKKICITFLHTFLPWMITRNSKEILEFNRIERQKEDGKAGVKEKMVLGFLVSHEENTGGKVKGEISITEKQEGKDPNSAAASISGEALPKGEESVKDASKGLIFKIFGSHKYGNFDTDKPVDKYVNYFLYFILASLLFLSYYKAFSVNRENNIQEPFLETLISTNSYLADTSIIDKLRANFIFILLAVCLVSFVSALASLVAWLFINTKSERTCIEFKNYFYQFQRIAYYVAGTTLLLQLIPMFIRVFDNTSAEDCLGKGLLFGYWGWSSLFFLGYYIYSLKKCPSELKKRKKRQFIFMRFVKGVLFFVCLCFTIAGPVVIEKLLYRSFFYKQLHEKGDLKFTPKVSIHSFDDTGETFKLRKEALSDSLYILRSSIYLTNEWKEILISASKSLAFEIINTSAQLNDTIRIDFRIELQDSALKTSGGNWVIPYNATKEISIKSEPQSKQVINRIEQVLNNRNSSKCRYIISYFPENKKESLAFNYMIMKIE